MASTNASFPSSASPSAGEPSAFADPLSSLHQRFASAIASAYPDLAGKADPMISPSRQPQFGDFQCNAAMGIAKQVGKNPREVAAALIAKVDLGGLVEPLSEKSIAGPGFINLTLRGEALASALASIADPSLGVTPAANPETVVVDLCGVNLAKEMHVGHLRSTVIPDAIARTIERLGHRVIRQSHLGDWGLPIAMVTAKLAEELKGGRLNEQSLKLRTLDALYKRSQAECERDAKGLDAVRRYGLGPKAEAELEAQVSGATEAFLRARDTLLKLQSHDPATVRVWKLIYDLTMKVCVETCARLKANVTLEHTAGESSYAEELAPLVEDLLARGVAEIDDGAAVVRVEGVEVPCLIRKTDGGFLYATTDIAAIRRRVGTLGASRVIYGVDIRQALHFRQVFAAAIKAGYADLPAASSGGAPPHDPATGERRVARLEHASFGTVLGPDGKPLKTRSGENVRLGDLLDEAVDRARTVVDQRSGAMTEGERAAIAEAVGIAAVKYADLSTERSKDYVFDFDRMLAFEGNTGPYLLYALVRTRSIFRKAAEEGKADGWRDAPILIREPAEKRLALELLRYARVLHQVGETLEPHRMCQYLYDLATTFSSFFDACPVVFAKDDDARRSRLRLCDLTGRVLADGLATLGLPTVERM
jgi:arginyl-tRNA synthetase